MLTKKNSEFRVRALLVMPLLLGIFATVHAQGVQPRGALIFSVERLELSRPPHRNGVPVTFDKTGIFYHVEERPVDEYGPLVRIYRFDDGELVETVFEGSISSELLLNQLRALSIQSFDIAARVEEVKPRAQREAKRQGKPDPLPYVLDGTKYRLTYDFNGVRIEYEAWNPGAMIDALAEYDADLANLKALLDTFALQYGRRRFGL